MARCFEIAARIGGRRKISLIDADVEAGLLKLFFNIHFAFLNERQEVPAQPGNLGERETMLGDVDCLTGEVRRSSVTLGWCCIAIDVNQMLLELDGANRGVDL